MKYKRGNIWTSELDLCIVSPNLLNYISNFNIIQDVLLTSDHAPLSFTLEHRVCLDTLLEQASFLGDHAALYNKNSGSVCKKPRSYSQINHRKCLNNLSQCELPRAALEIESEIQKVSKNLYECATASRSTIQHFYVDSALSRWDNLLKGNTGK